MTMQEEKKSRYEVKYTNVLTDKAFIKGMKEGYFVKSPEHEALITFLHYSALRISEVISHSETVGHRGLRRSQFRIVGDTLFIDVGKRLKHGIETPPLEIPLTAPYMNTIIETLKDRKPKEFVWPYCRKTGYNIVKRVFHYPHYHRLSRITQFFLDGYSIAEVKSWTGLSLKALDYYVGLVSIHRMGESLKKN